MSTETNEYPNDEVDSGDHPVSLLGRYALGALDHNETERVTRHVQNCRSCRAELAAYEEVVSLLPYAAPVHQVPLRARAGLLTRLDEIGAGRSERISVLRPPARERRNLLAWLRRPHSRPIAAFAMIPLVVIIAVVSIMANVINDQQEQLATIEAEQEQVERIVLGEPGKESAEANFISSTSAPGARAKLIVNQETNSALILARDLPQVEDDQHYIAWLRMNDENEYARAGVLDIDDEGRAVLTVEPRDAIASYAEVVVTLESDPEAVTPSGPRIMTAAVVAGR